MSIEQNGLRKGYNLVKLRRQEAEDGQPRVAFGGGAITRLSGVYTLF
ncbi:MAG TPA: hypothetical protein VF646_10025 [Cytophagales bacterium]